MDKLETIDVLKARILAIESGQRDVDGKQLSDSELNDRDSNLTYGESSLVDECQEEQEEGSSHKKSSPLSAFNKLVALINASEKSTHELKKRLVHAGYEPSEIEAALARAINCGLVDDARYASIFVRSRISQGWGREGIERELAHNGIDPETIEGWPHEFPLTHDEQVSCGVEFLQRKPPHARNLRDGAYRKLVNRGYSSSIASQAARLWYETTRA